MRHPLFMVPAAFLLLGSLAAPSKAQEVELTWDVLRHRWVDARVTFHPSRPVVTEQRPWHPSYRPRVAPTNRPCLPPPPPSCEVVKSCAPTPRCESTCEPACEEPTYTPTWGREQPRSNRCATAPRREQAPAPRCQTATPRCETQQPACDTPECEPVEACEDTTCEQDERGPREWRQSSNPVTPRAWRAALCASDLRVIHRALFETPDPAQQIARLAYVASQHTLTVDQAITLVAVIQGSAARREALFAIHGSVIDQAAFTRTYALLDPCDRDLLHVSLNQPCDGRGIDGSRSGGQRRTTWER